MFNVHGHLRKRVHINRQSGRLSVRIERQNSRDLYFWIMCLSTVMFGLFCNMLWGAWLRNPHDGLYAVFPVFALGLVCYVLAIAIGVWGAFGVEDISIEADSLRWTRQALKWTRTCEVRIADITEIRAITPWHGLDNTVEVLSARKQRRIGDRLLHDEALELAQLLRHAVGLTR
jgi:hypothetical protein